jgi:hypothetical protein
VNGMKKRLHLPLIFGFLILAPSTGAGQISTAKPGQSAEKHLSGEQIFQEWSLEPDPTDST